MDKNANWSLRIALALPVLMIGIVAISIYVPGRFQTYQGKFIYAVQDPGVYGYAATYSVVQGKLQTIMPPLLSSATYRYPVAHYSLYMHDLKTNISRDLTFEEAQTLTLDPKTLSSDGLQIVCGNRTDSPLFFVVSSMPDCSTMYAQGPHSSLKLNMRLKPGSYYNQFQFLGWVQS
jgi:hypothetical protein